MITIERIVLLHIFRVASMYWFLYLRSPSMIFLGFYEKVWQEFNFKKFSDLLAIKSSWTFCFSILSRWDTFNTLILNIQFSCSNALTRWKWSRTFWMTRCVTSAVEFTAGDSTRPTSVRPFSACRSVSFSLFNCCLFLCVDIRDVNGLKFFGSACLQLWSGRARFGSLSSML